jgi:hypothetical protein
MRKQFRILMSHSIPESIFWIVGVGLLFSAFKADAALTLIPQLLHRSLTGYVT